MDFSKIKAIASDIDGTLAIKGGDLMPLTREMLNKLHAQGILFGPASGRPMDERILKMASKWGLDFEFDFAIGMNGGELWQKETNRIDRFYQLPQDLVKRIVTFLYPLDCNIIVYKNGYEEVRAKRMDTFMRESIARNGSRVVIGGIDVLSENPTGKVEIQLKPDALEEIEAVIAANDDPAWSVVQTFRGPEHVTLEFMDPRVNKGVGLISFAKHHGLQMDEILAFGDQNNDIGLLKEAGWGVCLINGSDESKAVSQDITEYDVFNDGVGHYLKDHFSI